MNEQAFDYQRAFARNLGWVSSQEQELLRRKTIAIGGLGGVGGHYLLALTRLGIGRFSISDLDHYDLSNFNRQTGANLKTLNFPKLDTLLSQALDINPSLQLRSFAHGLNEQNFEDFLSGADIFIDSLDLYTLPLKMKIFNACFEKQIPIISAAPIGMSSSMIVFTPNSMSPSDYFGISSSEPIETQIIKFLVGINPTMKSLKALVAKEGLEFKNRKLPSLVMGMELCAAAASTMVMKVLLNRGPIVTAPRTIHFDAYLNSHSITWRPLGARNPLQWLMVELMKRRFL